MLARTRHCNKRYTSFNLFWYIFFNTYAWVPGMGPNSK